MAALTLTLREMFQNGIYWEERAAFSDSQFEQGAGCLQFKLLDHVASLKF